MMLPEEAQRFPKGDFRVGKRLDELTPCLPCLNSSRIHRYTLCWY
jgi:hypothetical protein